jgi:hypothetical protein
VSHEHAYRVAHVILVGPGWDEVTELVRLTFHRPAGDPSAEWVYRPGRQKTKVISHGE